MIDNCSSPPLATRVSSLYLDYGADAQECGARDVEITELGMRVRSRWQFEIGTELSLAFVGAGGRLGAERFTVQVIVVSCEPSMECAGLFESTLLFTEMPAALRRHLREVVA